MQSCKTTFKREGKKKEIKGKKKKKRGLRTTAKPLGFLKPKSAAAAELNSTEVLLP